MSVFPFYREYKWMEADSNLPHRRASADKGGKEISIYIDLEFDLDIIEVEIK